MEVFCSSISSLSVSTIQSPCAPISEHDILVRYVPAWFPFANFRRIGAVWNKSLMTSVNMPFDTVKADMVNQLTLSKMMVLMARCTQATGTAEPSFCARSLENRPPGITDDNIKWSSGSLCESQFSPMPAALFWLIIALPAQTSDLRLPPWSLWKTL